MKTINLASHRTTWVTLTALIIGFAAAQADPTCCKNKEPKHSHSQATSTNSQSGDKCGTLDPSYYSSNDNPYHSD